MDSGRSGHLAADSDKRFEWAVSQFPLTTESLHHCPLLTPSLPAAFSTGLPPTWGCRCGRVVESGSSGTLSFSSISATRFHILALALPSAEEQVGHEFPEPLEHDLIAVLVIVADDAVLVVGSFGHGVIMGIPTAGARGGKNGKHNRLCSKLLRRRIRCLLISGSNATCRCRRACPPCFDADSSGGQVRR